MHVSVKLYPFWGDLLPEESKKLFSRVKNGRRILKLETNLSGVGGTIS